MSRIKPTEMRLVAALLEGEAEDSSDLAARIIQALDEKRAKDDDTWIAIAYYLDKQGSGHIFTFGPYATRNQAQRDIDKMTPPGDGDWRVGPFKLYERKDG